MRFNLNSSIVLAIIIGIVAVLSYFMRDYFSSNKGDSTEKVISMDKFPKHEIPNDKLVIVNNIVSDDIHMILNVFCGMYNTKNFRVLPRLYKTGEKQFAITFPYDIDFTAFCFLVNYVRYPKGFKKSFDVTGWTTTKNNEAWVTGGSSGKKIMIFIPESDQEYDNVYLTTADNTGYKIGFEKKQQSNLLNQPEKIFADPQIDISDLQDKEYIDFK